MGESDDWIIKDVVMKGGIQVIGLGGAGVNTVARMARIDKESIEYCGVDTDIRTLDALPEQDRVLVGEQVLRGYSTGGDSALAKTVFVEEDPKWTEDLGDRDMVVLIVGLGGGVGSGISVELLKLLKEYPNVLKVVFACMPFSFEGETRKRLAEHTLGELRKVAHAVVPLPNDLLLQSLGAHENVVDSFTRGAVATEDAVRRWYRIAYEPGLLNVDVSTMKQVFKKTGGRTLFGYGEACGPGRLSDVLTAMQRCPMLHLPNAAQYADALIILIEGGAGLSLAEVNELSAQLNKTYQSQANTIVGAMISEDKPADWLAVSVVGVTELKVESKPKSKRAKAAKQQVLFDEKVYTEPAKKEAAKTPYFITTEAIWYRGEDLDVPTYLRKGVNLKSTGT